MDAGRTLGRLAASCDFLLDLSLSFAASALYGSSVFDSFVCRNKRNKRRQVSHN